MHYQYLATGFQYHTQTQHLINLRQVADSAAWKHPHTHTDWLETMAVEFSADLVLFLAPKQQCRRSEQTEKPTIGLESKSPECFTVN